MSDPIFDPKNEVKSQFIGWGKVGDWFKGTLVDIREMESTLPGKEGEMVKLYEFKIKCGAFHRIDDNKQPIEPAEEIKEGEFWTVGGRKGIDNGMRNAKKGQIVGMKFMEEKAPKQKGYNALKIIKVFLADMDPEFMGETSQDVEQ